MDHDAHYKCARLPLLSTTERPPSDSGERRPEGVPDQSAGGSTAYMLPQLVPSLLDPDTIPRCDAISRDAEARAYSVSQYEQLVDPPLRSLSDLPTKAPFQVSVMPSSSSTATSTSTELPALTASSPFHCNLANVTQSPPSAIPVSADRDASGEFVILSERLKSAAASTDNHVDLGLDGALSFSGADTAACTDTGSTPQLLISTSQATPQQGCWADDLPTDNTGQHDAREERMVLGIGVSLPTQSALTNSTNCFSALTPESSETSLAVVTATSNTKLPHPAPSPNTSSTVSSQRMALDVSRHPDAPGIDNTRAALSEGTTVTSLEVEHRVDINDTSFLIPYISADSATSSSEYDPLHLEHHPCGPNIDCSDSMSTSAVLVLQDRFATNDNYYPSECLPPSSLLASRSSDSHILDEAATPFRSVPNVQPLVDELGIELADDQEGSVESDVYGESTTVCGFVDAAGTELAFPVSDGPAVDLPPSSPPSSSPPRMFSSPRRDFFESPPSSSPPLPCLDGKDVLLQSTSQNHEGMPATAYTQLQGKRPFEEDDLVRSPHSIECSTLEEKPWKRMRFGSSSPRYDSPNPPNPKRPTPASQAQQRKKLAAPFRSPVVKGPLLHGGLHAVYATGRAIAHPPLRQIAAHGDVPEGDVAAKPASGVSNKDRTANAAKQFKSPLQSTGAALSVTSSTFASASNTFSSVRAAPTIQALQGKVQALKQAIKIKNSGKGDEDEVLEQLVKKWTAAGQELAWALWGHVKDIEPETDAGTSQKSTWVASESWGRDAGQKREFDVSWGYADERPPKKARTDTEDDGTGEYETQVVEHNLGVMLRRLGIDPATLGWDEGEGDFVDT